MKPTPPVLPPNPAVPSARLDGNQAVRLDDVGKAFGADSARMVALAGANFAARFGELTMLVGPSGCGKTTLLSILAGTLRPDTGSVNVLGHLLHNTPEHALTRFRAQHVGFVFQQFNLIPTLTAAENVAVPLIINGTRGHVADAQATALLERVGLKERAADFPAMLSGGQQQRVAIARALLHDPRLLVCDEPTSALDSDSGRAVISIIRELACDPRRCVIVVSHDPRIYRFADRMAEMEDGRVTRVLDSAAAIAHAYGLN